MSKYVEPHQDLAQLPAALANDGKAEARDEVRVEKLELQVCYLP